MLNSSHREAEVLSEAAATANAENRVAESLALYSEAAEREMAALAAVPLDKVRTRSVLSVSVASLLYKAGRLSDAEVTIYQTLAHRSLEPWAERQLKELLQVVIDEQTIAETVQRRYSGEDITVALRGGEIGSGSGPLDLILAKASGFQSLLCRFAEWIGHYPLRLHGSPPGELTGFVQARVTEPTSGSYRLRVRLTAPIQPGLFESDIQPKQVSDAVFTFLCLLSRGKAEELEAYCPQSDYRRALLQLTRNVAPSGRRIKEIGVYRNGVNKPEAVYLTSEITLKIRELIPNHSRQERGPKRHLRGVLRALHLDRHWLEITRRNGKSEKCDTVPDMLDDVVGPLVNREVIVSGPMRSRRGQERLLAEEVELAEEE